MYIQKIKVKNFKSIYDELEIDFDKVNGFWRITGDVGAGKTTIGEAILFSLFGEVRGKNNADLISWGENHGLVEVWANSKKYDLYIKREINRYGQSPIYAEVDGKELVFTNKRNAQKQLESDYYDVSQIMIELLCIISFNNFKSLATLNTSDTKQFLDQIFGFYVLTDYVNKCKDIRIGLKDEINKSNYNIRSIQDQIKKIEDISNMARISGNIKDSEESLRRLKEERDDALKSSDDILAKYRNELLAQQTGLEKVKLLGINKKKEIDFIKKGKCPTCGAPIDQSSLDVKEKEREVLAESYKMISKDISTIQDNITKAERVRKSVVEQFRGQISEEESLLAQLKEQEKRSKINIGEISELSKVLVNENTKLDALNKDDVEWSQLQDILGMEIRSKILNSFIPMLNQSIQDYATQFRIPYIIEFDESFDCHISLYGINQPIPISSLSTGQLKVVDISIILGVLKTILTGANFNICLLDELISNMDRDLRQVICEVLRNNVNDKQTLFIISHTELDDKYFIGSIDVELLDKDNVHKKSKYVIKSF